MPEAGHAAEISPQDRPSVRAEDGTGDLATVLEGLPELNAVRPSGLSARYTPALSGGGAGPIGSQVVASIRGKPRPTPPTQKERPSGWKAIVSSAPGGA